MNRLALSHGTNTRLVMYKNRARLSTPISGPLPFDYSRFLFFGEASAPNNGDGILYDQSGHGNDFYQTDDSYKAVLSYDDNGEARYNMLNYNYWNSPVSVSTPGSFEFHLALDLVQQGNSYYYDSNVHRILIGNGDALYYSTIFGLKGGGLYPTIGKHVLSWILNAETGTGSVLVDGKPFFTDSYSATMTEMGRLGADYSVKTYAPTRGYLYAFAMTNVLGSTEQVNKTIKYLRDKLRIPQYFVEKPLVIPMLGGVKSVSFLLRRHTVTGPNYLCDFRESADGYLYFDGSGNYSGSNLVERLFYDTAQITNIHSPPYEQWVRVYFEVSSPNMNIHLLQRYSYSERMNGSLSDVRVYSRNWTDNEINNVLVSPSDSLIAHYDFININGNIVPDVTGKGNTALLAN